MRRFTDEDWAAAVATWRRRDVGWQVKFATVAAVGDSQAALDLLVEMVASPGEDVMEAAAGGLCELKTRGRVIALASASLERLRALAGQASTVQRSFLGAFLHEIGAYA